MYLNRKAELVCEVHVNGDAAVEFKWCNESDDKPLQKKAKKDANTHTVTATITYEEWSKGMKWYCQAELPNSMEPPTKKFFEKNNGE